jgi:hypothetical protein
MGARRSIQRAKHRDRNDRYALARMAVTLPATVRQIDGAALSHGRQTDAITIGKIAFNYEPSSGAKRLPSHSAVRASSHCPDATAIIAISDSSIEG